jgi:NADH-quinone oxidoreductase subunit M
MSPLAVVPLWDAPLGDRLMPVAAAVAVFAPIVGIAGAQLAGERVNPRLPAGWSLATSLAAAIALAGAWRSGTGQEVLLGPQLTGGSLVHLDGLTAILLPMVATVALAIVLVAPRRAVTVGGVTRLLAGAALTAALMTTSHPLALVILWVASLLPTWLSTRATPGGRPTARVYAIMMITGSVLFACGVGLMTMDPPWAAKAGAAGTVGGWCVALAVMIRKGIVPFHSWYPAVFTAAPMSAALAATMPQVASYAAVRLLVGHADGVRAELVVLSQAALVTAAYGAALAVVQRDVRGLVGTLALSQSAMVLAGLSGGLPMELCGALAVWVSSGLALTGIGLVAWALESRAGMLALDSSQGRFADAPALAAFFLLFGLASLGFPGTLSFVADDLIVAGSLGDQPHAGVLVIVATVFSGIAVVRGWFRIFGGPATPDAPRHPILRRERLPLTLLLAVLFGLGLWPGPFVQSLEQVAASLLASRHAAPALSLPGDHP